MKKKYSLPRNSLNKIVDMMECVEEHDETMTEKDFQDKFGKDGHYMF